jgi:hypothetical protein
LLGLQHGAIFLQLFEVETVLANEVSQVLDRPLGILLYALQELALVTAVEVLDTLFKLNLSGAKRVDLHKLLQVEEGFGNGELVGTAGTSEERLKLGTSWQLQNDLVDFSEWDRVHKLVVFPVENRLHEETSDLLHVGVLEQGL